MVPQYVLLETTLGDGFVGTKRTRDRLLASMRHIMPPKVLLIPPDLLLAQEAFVPPQAHLTPL